MSKQGKIILGVTGGISAYKSVDICSRLKKRGYQVKVVLTEAAQEFVTPLTFETISENPVTTELFPKNNKAFETEHINHARWADLFLVCPATANILGKLACGIADDFLSTMLLAVEKKIVIAPAMNSSMYKSAIVQQNMEKLKAYGCEFIKPGSGSLACGEEGVGRLSAPEEICAEVDRIYNELEDDVAPEIDSKIKGKRVLVTAGATRERIDPVRYITNPSSGKMGFAIASALKKRGAEVILIAAFTEVDPPEEIDSFIRVTDTGEMYSHVMDKLHDCDIIIKAAAVSDFKPKTFKPGKLKKGEKEKLFLELEPTPDILKEVGEKVKDGIVVGFAAETQDLISNAKNKLRKKNLDLIVANDISSDDAGFGRDINTVKLIYKSGDIKELPTMKKELLAKQIVAELENIIDDQ